MSLYKSARCHFFDDNGRPVKPFCKNGDHCRFIHPEDAKWFKARPSVYRSGGSSNYTSRTKTKTRSRTQTNSSSTAVPGAKRRSSPLPPQSDLFKREVDCDVDNNSSIFDDYRRVEQRCSAENAKPFARPYDNHSYLGVEKPDDRSGVNMLSKEEAPAKEDGGMVRNYENNKTTSSVSTNSPAFRAREMATAPTSQDENISAATRKADTHEIIDLFQRIANLSNNVIQDSASFTKEEQKLQRYTELSSALSKVSPSAASAVSSPLTDIITRHAQYKKKVERDYEALGHVWEDVFSVFVKGITQEINTVLEGAIEKVRSEGEGAVKFVSERVTAATLHRANRSTPTEPNAYVEERGERVVTSVRCQAERETTPTRPRRNDDNDSREHKRRRFTLTQQDDTDIDRHDKRVKTDVITTGATLENILAEMKLKMAQQAQKLETLVMENNQLKDVIKKQVGTPSISSSSLSFSSNAPRSFHRLSYNA